jgi:hypothetical protein
MDARYHGGMRWMLPLSLALLSLADMVAFSGAHLIGIGNIAREQVDTIRVKADEYSRTPV